MSARPPPLGASAIQNHHSHLSSTPSSSHSTLLQQRQKTPPQALPLQTVPANGQSVAVSSPTRRKPLPGVPASASSLDAKPLPPINSNNSKSPEASSSPASSSSFVIRDLDRFPHGQPLVFSPKAIDQQREVYFGSANGRNLEQSVHSRLVSEPLIPLASPTLSQGSNKAADHKRSVTMALHPRTNRPPPLRADSVKTMPSPSEFKNQPKTPGNKITSFFGWKSASSPGAESSSTEISDSGHSNLPSPINGSALPTSFSSRYPSHDSYGAPAPRMPDRSFSIAEQDMNAKLKEMEHELREISSELAGSIKREMELEDLVERLQLEATVGPEPNRRTSDYFSDSGTSSVKYPLSDAGGNSRAEEFERMKRNLEQERAQLKVDLSQRWQEERSRRVAFESHVRILEGQVEQLRRERVDASNISAKTKELEAALEDTRRRLTEERQLKDNFEDLLTAMRVELEQLRNERDQLRNETVPQLQAKLQHDLQGLRNENVMLSQARKIQLDMQQQQVRINSIAEEDGMSMGKGSLSRSNSLARGLPRPSGLGRSGSVSRPGSRPASIIGKEREFKESLVDRMKDVEMQRDALHQTVRSLLERQNVQTRENEKRIRMLEIELERARQSGSPRRLGYERDVINLREEINLLRRRADEALEQKWQCEKGLAGLKMDLDRAEQETGSLRALLQEHDILVPAAAKSDLADFNTSSSSLEDAFTQLQADSAYVQDPDNGLGLQVLQQLATNKALKQRLSEAIDKGEREQNNSATRINELQTRLKFLEDALMAAQHASEEEVAKHEREIEALKETHNAQLMRAKNGSRSPALLSPRMPKSPFSGPRSPRLGQTTSGEGISLNQAIKMEAVEARVQELEKALREADREMETVVGRMNMAQIEVAELQSDRDEAIRQTRKLQAQIQAEREKCQKGILQ
ncbi:uncharacterized protein BDCG_05440 [Blastomyces dermatitidis ER-3]|uniref:DUF7603 domain-containing protein n=1 Tax=Ajellomyces dermatitidis (strain ER-3 / ATCC MYA-2586) TaxID=559297 RepID=A0ABP2F0X0_AJEDR|nr:uncharacterized protein BDCG_05440 [Blastomyces dermatitidis ER-3]EEQ90320.2 hypothetical protein BDCG_05440 [Blastomyces dermatitidis ER-3]